jgi:hypothetical protein
MPIKGLSDIRRFSRGGKIRLGEKRKTKDGKEYPAKLDYMLFDPTDETLLPKLHQQFGDKPDKISVCFASEDVNIVFPQWYKCYGATGLLCKGDGVTANRVADGGTFIECECPTPEHCEYAISKGKQGKPGCKQLASLQFFLTEFDQMFVWQIDTTSFHSIVNVNSALDIMKRTLGRISFIPVTLILKPQQIQPDGKKQIAYVLDVIIPCGLRDIGALKPLIAGPQNVALPPLLEHEAPDDLYPASQIPVDADGVVTEFDVNKVPPFDHSDRPPTLPATALSEPDQADGLPFDDDAPAQHDYSQVPKQDKPVTPQAKPPEPPHDITTQPSVVALQDKLSPTAFRVMTQQAKKDNWTLEQLLTAMRGRIKQAEESVL